MAKLMKPFTADLTDADVSCPTYECSIRVIVATKQLEEFFDTYDLEKETDLIVAIADVFIEVILEKFGEKTDDGRPLIDEDKQARDNAFDEIIREFRDNTFQDYCLSGYYQWWQDGNISDYADKIKCHEFVKIIHLVRQEHNEHYGSHLPDKMDAEDVFGWLIYFASEYLDLTLEKVWVDEEKYQEGAELLEWHKKLVKERNAK